MYVLYVLLNSTYLLTYLRTRLFLSGWCCFSDCRCCLRVKSVRHLLSANEILSTIPADEWRPARLIHSARCISLCALVFLLSVCYQFLFCV